ncbi:MAG: Lon protease family protein [Hyphomicrobiales bacterium]
MATRQTLKPKINGKLSVRELRNSCDPAQFDFKTTDDLEPVSGLVGQDRALSAIEFAADIKQKGFNLYALGPSGLGRHRTVSSLLEAKAKDFPPPDEWVYVNNFQAQHKPIAIKFSPGHAERFKDTVHALIDDLASSVPALFQSDDYQSRRRSIDEEISGSREQKFEQLRSNAKAQNIAIIQAPNGFALAPMSGGEVIKPEIFERMAEAERLEIQEKIQALQSELSAILQQMPLMETERRRKVRSLNTEFAHLAVDEAVDEVAGQFKQFDQVQTHLQNMRLDLLSNVELFLAESSENAARPFTPAAIGQAISNRFRRYMVNVLYAADEVDDNKNAPVVAENFPTLANLVGRIEQMSQMGTLVTDFLLIKPGALHKANGGYLILDARKVLSEPFAWEALKRCLRGGAIKITSAGAQMSFAATATLEPDPIPLSVKVVLIGERQLYYLLVNHDPDFKDLFKVAADFEEEFERNPDNLTAYARLIASIARENSLKPIARAAVAHLIDEAMRNADDVERLSLHIRPLADIMREANHWADSSNRRQISLKDVERAVEEKTHRSSRIQEKSHETITRDFINIETDGAQVGQINGLSVLSIGDFRFGRPTRISARARMGTGKLIDIEREVELGGPLHSKGVLILTAYLSSRFALDVPISLWASLVFEQSYGGVDGDSASCAELCALLSALSGVPLSQAHAITGSVSQNGEVQAIGGVNEKIEGFFDICAARGLTGKQTVLIPETNKKNLMIRPDVAAAVRKGEFHVCAVKSVDEAIENLTGMVAGIRGEDGKFPADTINGRVEERLRAFALQRKKFARSDDKDRNQGAEV